MESMQALLAELEAVLIDFPLRHIEQHVLPSFRVSLETLARRLQRSQLPIRAATLAPLLVERTDALRMDSAQLYGLIRTLKLKGMVLSERRDWFAYRLSGACAEPSPLGDAIRLAPRRLQHALRHSRNGRRDIEVHSVQLDAWIVMAAAPRSSVARPLLVAFQPVANYALVSRRSLPGNTATAIANGLGWSSAEFAGLHGRHLDSLLRVLEQDKNGTVNGLTMPQYEQRALVEEDGIHANDLEYNLEHAKSILGREPPVLRRLEGRSRQPFCDGPETGPLDLAVAVESDDVAETLLHMVKAGAIHPNSEWLHLFRSTTTNVVDLDALDD